MDKVTCLLCSAINIKGSDIKNTHLQSVYEELSDLKIQNDSHCLCYICHVRLQQCYLLLKQISNLQKITQNEYNNIEHKSVVHLSIRETVNTSIPQHMKIKQESSIKEEESSDCLKRRKTNAEYCKEYYQRKKAAKIAEKRQAGLLIKKAKKTIKKTGAERTRAYRLRKKMLAQLKQSSVNEVSPASSTSNSRITSGPVTTGASLNHPDVAMVSSCTADCDDLKECDGESNQDYCQKEKIDNSSISYRYSLKKPKRTHAADKPYTCDMCDKQFSQKCRLKIHKITHIGEKLYCCNICNKGFNVSSSLKRHEITHTGQTPYTCDICDKSFNLNISLKIHKRTHTGEKPYSCNICDKKFAQINGLYVHQRLHTGDKPYSCNSCDKKFKTSNNLKVHQRTHTGDKPYKL